MKSLARLVTLGLSVLMAPTPAQTQQAAKLHRIGVLDRASMALNGANLDAFRRGMREFGYVEGQNLILEYRYADDYRYNHGGAHVCAPRPNNGVTFCVILPSEG